MTTKEEILAQVGEPLYQVCKSDSVSLSAAWIDVDAQTYQDAGLYAEYGRRVLYTADQVLAARKPLEEENQRLRMALADTEALEIGTGEQCEQLRQQLAEKDAEIERLNEEGNMSVKYYQPNGKGQVYAVYGSSSINFADFLLEKLSAAQAREQQRAANACAHNWHDYGSLGGENVSRCSRCNALAFTGREPEALAIPTDTSALEAMIQKAGEVMRERVSDECFRLGILSLDGRFMDEIRAMPGVTLEDLK